MSGPYLVFDTETTGLPDFRAPSDAPHQPHLAQFAAILLSQELKEVGRVSLLVRPEWWEIPPEVSAIHGITTDHALLNGVRKKSVSSLFLNFLMIPNITLVAHNIQFDMRIMRIALLRAGWDKEKLTFAFSTIPQLCTMEAAKPLLTLPPTPKMRSGFKPPRLSECYSFFFGLELAGAHDAMVDTEACARVFLHLKTNGHIA